jgi:hypothetical protein
VNELSAMFISAQRNLSALNLPVRLFSGAQRVMAQAARTSLSSASLNHRHSTIS